MVASLLVLPDLSDADIDNVNIFAATSCGGDDCPTRAEVVNINAGSVWLTGVTGGQALNGVTDPGQPDSDAAYVMKANINTGSQERTSFVGISGSSRRRGVNYSRRRTESRRRSTATVQPAGTAFDSSGNAWVTVSVSPGCYNSRRREGKNGAPEDCDSGEREKKFPIHESFANEIRSRSDLGLMKIDGSNGNIRSIGTSLMGSPNRRRGAT